MEKMYRLFLGIFSLVLVLLSFTSCVRQGVNSDASSQEVSSSVEQPPAVNSSESSVKESTDRSSTLGNDSSAHSVSSGKANSGDEAAQSSSDLSGSTNDENMQEGAADSSASEDQDYFNSLEEAIRNDIVLTEDFYEYGEPSSEETDPIEDRSVTNDDGTISIIEP